MKAAGESKSERKAKEKHQIAKSESVWRIGVHREIQRSNNQNSIAGSMVHISGAAKKCKSKK